MRVGNVSDIQYNFQAFLIAFSNHINLTNVSASNTSYGVESYISHRNVIANSTFYHNHHAIYLGHSNYSTISNISSRENYGIEPRTGVYLYKSYHNLITNNTTVSSNRPGIRLDYSYYNTISYCNLTKNVVGGIAILYGGSNNISRCSMTENENGVYVLGSPWNNITNNTINNNTGGGIRIEVAFSDSNLMANNEIADNSDYGILIKAPNGIMNNMVILNNITGNGGYAVKIDGDNGGNRIHHNNMICNKGACDDGWQASDSSLAVFPPNQWDHLGVGNHWNPQSWTNNTGWSDIPKTYWVSSDKGPLLKDFFPQYIPFIQAGPQ
jgi:parallel beta-helix repeat protein